MASKTISQLDAKIPLSTDLVPVADSVTGVAGKTEILDLISNIDFDNYSPGFSPAPDLVSLLHAGFNSNVIIGVSGSRPQKSPKFIGTNCVSRFVYDGQSFSESNVTSFTDPCVENWGNSFGGSALNNFPKIQSISFPNAKKLAFSCLLVNLNSWNMPNVEMGVISATRSIYNFTGAFNPLPNLKYGTVQFIDYGTQISSFTLPEFELADSIRFDFSSPAQYRAPNLTSMSFPKLKRARQINIRYCQALTSLTFPELEECQEFTPNNDYVVSVSAPKLQYSDYALASANFSSLTTLSMPSLVMVRAALTQNVNFPLLTAFDLPELVYGGMPVLIPNTSLTAINYTFGNTAFLSSTAATVLQTINMPKLKYMGGNTGGNSINLTAASSLTTVNLNQTPKAYNGNIIITNAALNQASVDGILAACAYQDGVANAPWPAYSSKTINLSGGTSSTPSAAGLASKAILVARGCTVTHN